MTESSSFDDQPAIAVIGMACRFPGAHTPEAFWQNLCAGVQSIRRLDEAQLAARGVGEATRRHPNYVPVYSGPDDIEKFDAGFFGITPSEAECMDPQHRLLLECAHEALERAGIGAGSQRARVGVFAGVGVNSYLFEHLYPLLADPFNLAAGRFSRDMQIGLGNEKCYAATRISHKLNLRGPSVYVDAACATSLVAVHLACKSLLDFECDAAVAGGAKLEIPHELGYLYEEGGMTSPVGEIRAFDAGAKGTLFASGAGAVVLKRLEDAERDGDEILAVIRGSAINNDGSDKVGFTAPSFDGQRNVILEALAFAGVDADSIGYVEAHGTGTPLGDPIEIAALTAAYRASSQRRGYCAIGSLKPNVGHMEAASGVAGLIKTVLALRHRQLPPSLNYQQPNPEIDFASSPFFVNTALRDWTTTGPRRAGVSSFGVGGTNAHVIVEEYVAPARTRPSQRPQLLVWSAKTERALDNATAALAEHLRAQPQQELADVAHTLQSGRETFSRRSMLVCVDRDAALAALDGRAVTSAVSEGRIATAAFLFPGQGAQHVGMAHALYRNERVFRDALRECAQQLQPHLGLDLLGVLYPEPGNEAASTALLDQTWLTQPALFCVEYALAQQWLAWGVQPSAMLGHSIGEYVAACLAGVFALPDALKLVALRGRLMQSLPAGDMLAVPLAEADLRGLAATGWDVAAINGPRACVLSGPAAAIDAVSAELAERGIEGRRLRTSHAFHSSMMEPILAEFGAAVAAVPRTAPNKRFVSNVTGDWITAEQATSADYWVRHLRGAVRFSDGVQRVLAESGVVLLEVGPGHTLASLARQQEAARGRAVVNSLPHPREDRDAQVALLEALGRLWLADVAIDWAGVHGGETRRRVLLPTYPFERKRHWIDVPVGGVRKRATASADDSRQALSDWFHVPSWTTAPLPAASPHSLRDWLVFCDRSGVGTALAHALRARGDAVVEVFAGECCSIEATRATVRADVADDYAQLLAAASARGGLPTAIVHAWTVDTVGDDYARSQQLGFYSLLHLAQALGAQPALEPLTLTVLSRGLADVTGGEPLDPLKASVLGPAKVIAQEYPQIACRQIDIDGDVATAALLAELDADAVPGVRVAWRGRRRWKSEYAALKLAGELPAALPWRDHGVYLITGGLGGLGLVFAEHLARTCRAKLVLTARQGLPARGEWSALLAQGGNDSTVQRIRQVQLLEAAGAEVLVLGVDATDRAGMAEAVDAARKRFGTLHGAMHAAGIAGGGIMQRRTVQEAEAVLAPKIVGAQVLLDVLADLPLDFVLLHSSLFAVTGGAGQVDYCGANNVLDLLAHAHARRGVPVVAMNWDGWTEVGMAARAGLHGAEPQRRYVPLQHPLLDACAELGNGHVECIVDLHPARHWVVDEHRMGGQAVMPGTALLELAVAGFRVAQGGDCAVELSDVLFLTPLEVDGEHGRRARVSFSPAAQGMRFRIQSAQPDGSWRDHALGSAAIADTAAGRCDLDALRLHTEREHGHGWDFTGREADVLPTDGWLRFGTRWHSVKRIVAGDSEALIELALPVQHGDDVQQYTLHPALLDLATGLANGYWLEQDAVAEPDSPFLPFGYQRITVWRPLPAHCFAHSRLCSESGNRDDSLVFDILLVDAHGEMVAAIEGFTLKRVVTADVLTQAHRAAAPAPVRANGSDAPAPGISPAEGIVALERVLAYGLPPQIVITTRSLPYLLQLLNAPAGEATDAAQEHNDRPDLGSEFAAPRNELEHALAAIWRSLLGMKEVGINDNFFELGGDSLLATQIPNRIRSELAIGIDLGVVFQSPTIAQIADHITAKTWAAQARSVESDQQREVGTL